MASKVKIYTKTGDKGQTSLYGGKRVRKEDQRVTAYGTVDEFNSSLGVLIAHLTPVPLVKLVVQPATRELETILGVYLVIQSDLFTIGASLAGDTKQPLEKIAARIIALEQLIDEMDKELPELKNFILPGGGLAAACAHLSRAICRRAEREVIRLSRKEDVSPIIIRYLNRLSDLLFVTARYLTMKHGKKDIVWKQA